VRYRNRELDDTVGSGASVAGWYYISVLVDLSDTEVPVTIELSVTGDTHPVPKYGDDAGRNPFGDQSGRSASRSPRASTAAFGSDAGGGGPLLWVGIPLVVLLIAGVVTGWLVVRRRRVR
jgi:hypothetical protein